MSEQMSEEDYAAHNAARNFYFSEECKHYKTELAMHPNSSVIGTVLEAVYHKGYSDGIGNDAKKQMKELLVNIAELEQKLNATTRDAERLRGVNKVLVDQVDSVYLELQKRRKGLLERMFCRLRGEI